MTASTSALVTVIAFLYTSGTVLGRLTFTSQPIPLSSSPTRLSCAAAAESLPDIVWYKDDKIIPGSKSNAFILYSNQVINLKRFSPKR